MILNKESINKIFEYKDGDLYWKINDWKKVKIGKKAGSINPLGYEQVSFRGKKYYIHRLIFAMFYDKNPKYIDHIDGNPSNNKIENLRECSQSENMFNQAIRSNNLSGFKNVSWNSRANKWLVKLTINGKQQRIGLFDDVELANSAAIKARKNFHKDFARHL